MNFPPNSSNFCLDEPAGNLPLLLLLLLLQLESLLRLYFWRNRELEFVDRSGRPAPVKFVATGPHRRQRGVSNFMQIRSPPHLSAVSPSKNARLTTSTAFLLLLQKTNDVSPEWKTSRYKNQI